MFSGCAGDEHKSKGKAKVCNVSVLWDARRRNLTEQYSGKEKQGTSNLLRVK